jgi:hypothetical protein
VYGKVQSRGLRWARYRGLAKVRMEHLTITAGICLQRLDDWWADVPRVTTRTSGFTALAAA